MIECCFNYRGFFLICIVGGGVQTGSTRHVGHLLAYCTCPGWLWGWRIWWNEWQGKPKYSEKTYPGATLSTTNPTWPHPGLNPGRRGGKPATNRFSHGAAHQLQRLHSNAINGWKIWKEVAISYSTVITTWIEWRIVGKVKLWHRLWAVALLNYSILQETSVIPGQDTRIGNKATCTEKYNFLKKLDRFSHQSTLAIWLYSKQFLVNFAK
jgi:hypothetical protein